MKEEVLEHGLVGGLAKKWASAMAYKTLTAEECPWERSTASR
jgi:hypothetical protein